MNMKIVKMDETPIAETPHKVDVRKLYDNEHAQAVHIKLEAGESLKKTYNPCRCVFLCFRRCGYC